MAAQLPLFPGMDPMSTPNPRAYPAPPGSGPEGQTCRGCDHYCRVQGGAKAYPKCELMKANWTHGTGTDIKASSPACRLFVPKQPHSGEKE
jgi:hypothetical protein